MEKKMNVKIMKNSKPIKCILLFAFDFNQVFMELLLL